MAADDELDVFRSMLIWIDHERVERLEHAANLMTAIRLPLLPASVIVDSVESVEYLMNIPECQTLVKEALHYHCMPARQSVLQVRNYCNLPGKCSNLHATSDRHITYTS